MHEQLMINEDLQCKTASFITGLILLVTAVMLSSCSTMGPGTINKDQFNYNAAVARSWNEQMLMNMVRLRYGEAPVFLDVSSIIAQYSVTKQVSLSGSYDNFLPTSDDTVSLGVGGMGLWTDRPTITYAPRTGQQFTRSILTPPPLSSIFGMIQAGWSIDLVLGLSLRSINGVPKMEESRQKLNAKFFDILGTLFLLQKAGCLSLRQEVHDEKSSPLLTLNLPDTDPDINREISRLRKMLNLPEGMNEFFLVYGRLPENPNEIAMLTSSALEILIDLAAFFDVPDEHVEQGKTKPTITMENIPALDRAPIQVQATKDFPTHAFLAVQNRGYWFWIDDGDFPSKGRFSFLTILMRLAESGEQGLSPSVTISAGP